MESEKTCPKCATFPRMEKVDSMTAMIPAVVGDGNSLKTSETRGLPVEIYQCPLCHLVELYGVSSE